MTSPSQPTETVGDYHLVRSVDAAGGLGSHAYLALKRDENGEQKLYMVKLLAARGLARARALRELKQARKLEHPAIAAVREYFEHGRQLAVVFDYLDGLRLDQIQEHLQREHERLSDRAAWHVCHQLAGALGEAHTAADERGRLLHVSHGRLGPDQVQLSWQGQVRVFGVGLSSVFEDEGRGELARGYLPPEHGGGTASPQADVYGVAAITWSLLTGRAPSGALPLQAVGALRPDLPAALCELLDTALRPTAAQRRVTCQQLEQRLERAIDDVADATELRWNMDVFKALALFSRSRPPPGSEPPDSDTAVPPPMSRPHSHWIEQPTGASTEPDDADDEVPQRESAFDGAEDSVVERISNLFDELDLPSGGNAPGGSSPATSGDAVAAAPASAPSPPRPAPPRPGRGADDDAPDIDATEIEAVEIEDAMDRQPPPAAPLRGRDAALPAAPEAAGAGAGDIGAASAVRPPAAAIADTAAVPRAVLAVPEPALQLPQPPGQPSPAGAAAQRGGGLLAALGAAVLTGAVGFAAGWLLKPSPPTATDDGAARPQPTITVDVPSALVLAPSASMAAGVRSGVGRGGAGASVDGGGSAGAGGVAGAYGGASASAPPSAASAGSTAPPVASGDASKLLSYEGYLIVQSSIVADVYVQGKRLGTTNSLLKSRCYHRFVRLRDADSGKWMTAGRAVGIACMSTTAIRIEAASP